MVEAIGYVGSAGAATMWIPQAVRAVRHRADPQALAALSRTTYLVAVVFNVLLASYGLAMEARPVVLAGAVNLCCASVILGALAAGARRRRT
ncbi:hypothetical protein L615_000300000080 [Nocardioides sp. J9]|nr:hypothetical protein L615_000300000080 [Nocardioides sp. J9]